MKKVWVCLLCLMLLGAVALTAFAASDTVITVTADKTTVMPGDTVTVTVEMSGTDPLTSFGYMHDSDSPYFTVTRGAIQPAVDEAGTAYIKNFSRKSGLAVGPYEDPDTGESIRVTVNGDILVLTLQINEDAPVGSFTVTDKAVIKNHTEFLTFDLIEDTITVACSHEYGNWTSADDTNHVHTCTICGQQESEAHTWDDGIVTQAPSTSATGVKTYTCTGCGSTVAEILPVRPAPTPSDTKFYVAADKTTVYRGDTVTVTVSMYGSEPFTSVGYLHDNNSACFTVKKGVIQPAIDENATASIKSFSRKDGMVVGGYTDFETEADTAVTANGGILVLTLQINEDAPIGDFTVTNNINVKNGATDIGFELIEDTITVTCDHEYGNWTSADDTNHVHTCTICGQEATEAHTWDDGVVTQAPSTSATGEKTYTCTVCGGTRTQTLPKVCNTKFKVTASQTTAYRGDTVTVYVDMSGTDPLTSFGYVPFKDSQYFSIKKGACGNGVTAVVNGEEIKPMIADFSRPSGLTVGGYAIYNEETDQDESVAVTLNGNILTMTIGIKADAPFGEFSVTRAINVKNGSDTVEFNLEDVTITVACKHENATTTQIDANTHRYCCPDCGAEDVSDHSWDEGVVTTAPTCKDVGLMCYTCTGCAATKNKILPSIGEHTFSDWTSVDLPSHQRVCTLCKETETASHSFTLGICADCGAYEDYTVTFVDADGTVLSSTTYHYGDTVLEPEAPFKAADKVYTYHFAGWGVPVTNCTGDAVYRATYNAVYIDYTVTFVDADGTVLSSTTCHYGDTVLEPEAPFKAADKVYTYHFAGWDIPVDNCTGDATYRATYNAVYIDYTVTFVNEDGTVIATGTYHYGDTVTVPADPEKEANEQGTFAFAGWSKDITVCEEDTVYTALFTFTQYPPDFDGTGVVTDADAIYLLRYTLFTDDYPVHLDTDVNGDGLTTDADAIYLLRHTLFPEEYPLYPKKEN